MKALLFFVIALVVLSGCASEKSNKFTVKVADSSTGTLISNAQIGVFQNGSIVKSISSDSTGIATFELADGAHEAKVSANGYADLSLNFNSTSGSITALMEASNYMPIPSGRY